MVRWFSVSVVSPQFRIPICYESDMIYTFIPWRTLHWPVCVTLKFIFPQKQLGILNAHTHHQHPPTPSHTRTHTNPTNAWTHGYKVSFHTGKFMSLTWIIIILSQCYWNLESCFNVIVSIVMTHLLELVWQPLYIIKI